MFEEVSTEDWRSNICNDKNPSKGASESEIKREGTCTVSRNCSVIDGLKAEALAAMLSLCLRRRYDTHFRTGIDQEA